MFPKIIVHDSGGFVNCELGDNITALHLRRNEGLLFVNKMIRFCEIAYSRVNLGSPNLTCLRRVCPTGQRSSTRAINL